MKTSDEKEIMRKEKKSDKFVFDWMYGNVLFKKIIGHHEVLIHVSIKHCIMSICVTFMKQVIIFIIIIIR